MKKTALFIFCFLFVVSCDENTSYLVKRTLNFTAIPNQAVGYATVKNTFKTIVKVDTLSAGTSSYTWDEKDNNQIHVSKGLYLITVTFLGNKLASGSYVVTD